MPTRRHILGGLSALSMGGAAVYALNADGDAAFLSCCRQDDGSFAVAVLDDQARVLRRENLPGRGHGLAVHPDGQQVIVFARRPGSFACVMDMHRAARLQLISAPMGRHFYGHGCFSPDGRWMYATENDYGAARGVIGIYDGHNGYRRVGEWESFGLGPHELILMQDGRTLAVANGGIETHPDYPRQKLNLSTMRPSLTFVDRVSGDLRAQAELPAHLQALSLRHIVETRPGEIWIGGQYEGVQEDAVPLIGICHQGEGIQAVTHGEAQSVRSYYIGSIAVSRDKQRICVTHPRAGYVDIWDVGSRTHIGTHRAPDVCGVAPQSGGFLYSTGHGAIYKTRGQHRQLPRTQWDNHMTALPPPHTG